MSDERGAMSPRGRPTVGQPSDRQDYVFEKFDGLNTKPLRPSIADGEAYIFDGWMPLGPSNARTLPDVGTAIFGAEPGITILWHSGCNLGGTPGVVLLQSDGSVFFVNEATTHVTQVMPSGTILSPTTIFGFRQWSTPIPFLLFAKDQTNGYWVWDGTNLFTAGGISPETTLTNAGTNYTSQPTITIQTTGSGTGAAFTANIENNTVSQLVCTNPGTGFGADDFVVVSFQGGGSDDSAYATADLSPPNVGGVDQIIINIAGSGYTGATTIVASGGGGSGASLSPVITNGVITSVAVINPGTGYTSPPTITANDPGYHSEGIPGGTGFSAFCNIAGGQVTGITINYGGTNYVTPPTVTIIGDGTGAEAIAVVQGGQLTNFIIQNFGSGYSVALVQLSGGNNSASATAQVFPWGISGTTIEVYNNQVWIANGGAVATFPPQNRVIGSAPGFATIFDPTQGAIAFQSNNAQLRVGYHALVQTNGFLYEIGDSAIDQISGVQTSTSNGVATTTFNNINVDPQIGTPWPSSVQLLNRNIVLANPLGIFVSYGGAVTKISDPLDGIYTTGPIFGGTANFSSAVAQIFGRYVYMLLLPIVSQTTGQVTNTLLMWDGKRFFTSSQGVALTYVSTLEINSLMTAYGTNGQSLYPLFQSPSTNFTKTAQSKLWATPGYDSTKQAMQLLGILNFYAFDDDVNITIDSEVGSNAASTATIIPGVTWVNDSDDPVTWVNNSNVAVVWGSEQSLVVFGPDPVGGYTGRLTGVTVQTNASNVALLSIKLIDQVTTLTP